MKYGSVCSGIEAASVAWHDLGWEPQWFSEIEQFPSEVLKHRFPDVPNLGDMTTINQNPMADERPIDLLVGGTPCQSFSVAGLRKGLDDPRGNLMLTFLSIADKLRPKWIVWENVPGVLSSNGGKDFGTFLGALGELGYGFAYRVLDAQHFGVAQRRRRVFVVGYLGDWRPPAAVLFERESLQGNTKPSRKKGKEITSDVEGSVGEAGDAQPIAFEPGKMQRLGYGYSDNGTSPTLRSEPGDNQLAVAQPLYYESHPNDSRVNGPKDVADTVSARYGTGGGNTPLVQQPFRKVRRAKSDSDFETWQKDETANTINCFDVGDVRSTNVVAQPIAVDWRTAQVDQGITQTLKTDLAKMSEPCVSVDTYKPSMAIRRLTPKECERLQGFPDDWTKIPYRNKEADQCPDGPRYKACGNSMAVPVMRWIGQRIQYVENLMKEL